MNIKEASLVTGLSEQMIRFYEKKGIISPKRNKENQYREYTNHEIFLIVIAHTYNSLGIPLDEVSNYIRPTSFEEHTQNLTSRIEALENEAFWLQERIRYSKDQLLNFEAYQQGKSYAFFSYKKLCFYPNEHTKNYSDLFKYTSVFRAALRVKKDVLEKDSYPSDDIGSITSREIQESSIQPVIYEDVKVIRFFVETPVSCIVTPKEVHKFLKTIHDLHFKIIGDAFIYQIAEKEDSELKDIVCVDFIYK